MPVENTINMGAVTTRLRTLAQVMELSVMVVDDDELVRSLIGDRLEARDIKITYATNGADALAMLKKNRVALALVDWQMPVMDGIEFTEALRARNEKDTYIIMLTTRDNAIDYERGYRAGVDDYLTKRVTDHDMLARIHAGFMTCKLRRALRESQSALYAATNGREGRS